MHSIGCVQRTAFVQCKIYHLITRNISLPRSSFNNTGYQTNGRPMT